MKRSKEPSKILTHEKWIAFSAIEQQQDNLNILGEDIWRAHDRSGHEKNSHDILVAFLKKRDFKVKPHYKGFPHAFRASFGETASGGAEHPNVGFLCQYDIDPERGHCHGHNLATAVAVTAALGLQPVIKFAQEPIGMVTIIGCQGNATGTGKIEMMEAGCFKGIDFLLTAYPAHFTNIKPRFIGCRTHKITFRGRTRKEGDRPWEVANPVNATVLAYQNIAAIRQQFNCEWVAKGVILNGGTRADVMPETASMEYLLKAPKPLEMKVLGDMVHQCFNGAATATGCRFDVESTGHEFLCNMVPEALVDLYNKNASLMGFTFHNRQEDLQSHDDIANVSTSVPTLKVFYYAGTGSKLGTDEFSRYAGSKESQFMTILQGKALAMMAVDLITSEERMRDVFEQHQEELSKYYGPLSQTPQTTHHAQEEKQEKDETRREPRGSVAAGVDQDAGQVATAEEPTSDKQAKRDSQGTARESNPLNAPKEGEKEAASANGGANGSGGIEENQTGSDKSGQNN
ncbi:peptidase m20 domain-containing protein 2-like [Plakobranchus ocellatus]|uniref:Peptidase m20 domain-containing protein 2-like n=1 Tax=Plakobranchus ocellatus TaxID=259542 RepID=A0AAV4APQ4_9GAST|nr:peptidase m20 domain-containing protein 2-like [Plakobranchus ocellatus]